MKIPIFKTGACTDILRGSRNLNLVLKIVLLQTFKIDCVLIIKFDTCNISFTNSIHQTCVVSSTEPVNVNVLRQGS